MTDHLPECAAYREECGGGCICHHVRACEERLREGWCVSSCGNTHYTIGYEEGLDAARYAVAAAIQDPRHPGRVADRYDCCGCSSYDWIYADALAAIDALREEQK